MKKTFFFAIIAVGQLLNSCKEHQILKSIDGRWKIQSMKFTTGQGAFTKTPIDAYLLFDQCVKSNNENSQCKLQYLLDGQPFNFYYHTTYPENFSSQLVIRLNNSPKKDSVFLNVSKEILGTYNVQLDEQKIILRCENCSLSQVGSTSYNIKEIILLKEK